MPFLQQHVIFLLDHFDSVENLTVSFDLHQPPTFARLLFDCLQMNIFIIVLLPLILRLF